MNFIQRKFPEGLLSRGKHGLEWHIDCPMCERRVGDPDTKKRLYINLKTDMCYCFHCHYKGHVKQFLWELDRTSYSASTPAVTLSGLRKRMLSLSTPVAEIRIDIPGFRLLSHPGKFSSYSERLESYLWDRGWSSHEINERQVGFSLAHHRFVNRLIFPFSNLQGEFCYYQARTVKPDVEPKYMNPPAGKDQALYNVRSASRYDTCVLVEGIFDCVLPNMVACLSKEPTDGQLRSLAGLWRDFVVLFDQDALTDGWKAAERLSALRCSCRVATCPAKDPGEANLADLEDSIREATPFDKLHFSKIKLAKIAQTEFR